MENISEIVNGNNGIPVLVFVALVLMGLYWTAKRGLISFKGKGLSVGQTRENELRIVREQLQAMEGMADASINYLPEELRTGCSYYRVKYVIAKFKDLMEQCIIYNHITKDPMYIKLKQDAAYNIIMKLTDDKFFRAPEFKAYLNDLVKSILETCVDVRETYGRTL